MKNIATAFALMALSVSGCETALPGRVAPDADQGRIYLGTDGRCYGKTITPAIIETITQQVLVQPAVLDSDGSVRTTAIYRTVTRQVIVQERRELEFQAVCPEALTPELISSLQRALSVRNAYSGPISGVMDSQTKSALRRWQNQNGGPDSAILSVTTAQTFGLIALTRQQIDALSQ